jgi:hypothetical protein
MKLIEQVNNKNIFDLCLHWETKAGEFCYSVKHKKLTPMPKGGPRNYSNDKGEWFDSPKNLGGAYTLADTKVLARAGDHLDYFVYFEYSQRDNVILWAQAKIASNRVYDSNGPEWKITGKGYIAKDKTVYFWNKITQTMNATSSLLTHSSLVILNTSVNLAKIFGKMWGSIVGGPNNTVFSLTNLWQIQAWLGTKEVCRKTGSSQIKIDEITLKMFNAPTPEMPQWNDDIKLKSYWFRYHNDRAQNVNIIYIFNEDVVIRNFSRRKYENGQIKNYEGARCVITPKKIIFASKNCFGEWCVNSALSIGAFEGTIIMANKMEQNTFAYWAFKTANEMALQAQKSQKQHNDNIEKVWEEKKNEFYSMVEESRQNASFLKMNEYNDSLHAEFKTNIMGKCQRRYIILDSWLYAVTKDCPCNVNYIGQILPIAINIIKTPIIEQIYKIGLTKLAYFLCKIEVREDRITPCLGKINKSNSLLQSLQINSFQCQLWTKLIQKIDWGTCSLNSSDSIKCDSLAILKEILGNDLRSVDNEIFKIYLEILEKIAEDTPRFSRYNIQENIINVIKSLKEFHNKNEWEDIIQRIYSVVGTPLYVNAIVDGWSQYIRIKDYNKTVGDNKKILLPKYSIKTLEEAQKFHDSTTNLYSLASIAISEVQFNTLSKFWTKYKFEDDKYQIVLPRSSADIVNEGVALHHCVKTYVTKVTQHETNILFLREKSNLDKPFFTIEVSNNQCIRQIHGFGNRWPATEPNVIPFIDKWVEAKKLSGWDGIKGIARYHY